MELGQSISRRRLGLTPLIDVVLLMLIFFMLTSRIDTHAKLDLLSGETASANAPAAPRLVALTANDIRLNGRSIAFEDLANSLEGLGGELSELVVVTSGDTVLLMRLVEVMSELKAHGFENISLRESGARQ